MYPRMSARLTAPARRWPSARVIAFKRHRSSKTVRVDRRSALCRAKNFSASSWTVNFPTSPSSSSSKRRHASNNKPGSYFCDCRITPNTCYAVMALRGFLPIEELFSSTASSAQSTKPFRFVSKMNFSASVFVLKNRRQAFPFSDNLAGIHTR